MICKTSSMRTQENENYLRYFMVLSVGGSALLRGKIENGLRLNGQTLKQFLQQSAVNTKVQNDKYLGKAQKEKLYPMSGHIVCLTDFDITLLSRLLCEYGISSDQNDLTVVKALRDMRNEIVHTNPEMDDPTYRSKWTALITLLLTESSKLSAQEQTNMKQILKKYAEDPLGSEVLRELKLFDVTSTLFEAVETLFQEFEKKQAATLDAMKMNQEETLENVKDVQHTTLKIHHDMHDLKNIGAETNTEVQVVKLTTENTHKEVREIHQLQQETLGEVKTTKEDVRTVFKETFDPFEESQKEVIKELRKDFLDMKSEIQEFTEVLKINGILVVQPESRRAVKLLVGAAEKKINNTKDAPEWPNVDEKVAEVFETIERPDVKVESVREGSVVLGFRCLSFDAVLQVIDCFDSSAFQDRIANVARALTEATKQQIHIRTFIDSLSLQNIVDYYKEHSKRKTVKLGITCTGMEGLIHAMDIFEGEMATESLNKLSEALSEAVGEPVKVRTSIDRNQLMKTAQTMKRQLGSVSAEDVESGSRRPERNINPASSRETLKYDTKSEPETKSKTKQDPNAETHSKTETDYEAVTVSEAATGFNYKSQSKPDTCTEFKPASELKSVFSILCDEKVLYSEESRNTEVKEGAKIKKKGQGEFEDNSSCIQPAYFYTEVCTFNLHYIGEDSWVSACAVLSDNRLLLVDCMKEKIGVYDLPSHSVSELGLKGKPFGVELLRNGQAVLTLPEMENLVVLKTTKQVSVKRYIPLGRQCWGITSSSNSRTVYVLCWKPERLLVFDLECETPISCLPIVAGEMFLKPLLIAISQDEKKLYVTGAWVKDRVIEMNLQGEAVRVFQDNTLEIPFGLAVLDDNNLICSTDTGTIHIISADLSQERVVQTQEDGINCMCLDSDKKRIFLCHKDRISVLSIRNK